MSKLTDLTPEAFRCIPASCPAVLLVEACPMGDCPAVYEAAGDLIIIGDFVTEVDFPELAGRIGENEAAVKISAELVREALKR